eukprot:CAMPEP_0117467742 /NCGR_PEP_ID=MMETSP0784-20121206/5815_1 /TAXON_ID=39447 /ORGANISM="" /LENGTH=216 /DNA_ID=CAMNT_0005261725 /DNA_START=78 /DNA_END=728 /DNA_ORIENTATION=+
MSTDDSVQSGTLDRGQRRIWRGSWFIELERGWSPWTPGDATFDGTTAATPLRFRMGKYDFEANFQSDVAGTQTNLATGKVRRIVRVEPGGSPPPWEASGARRRPVDGRVPLGTKAYAAGTAAPPGSAAYEALVARDARRTSTTPTAQMARRSGASPKSSFPSSRGRVEAPNPATNGTSSVLRRSLQVTNCRSSEDTSGRTSPRFMRPTRSFAQRAS